MKTKEAYTNVMIELVKLEAKVDVLLKLLAEIKSAQPVRAGELPVAYDTVIPKTPYALTSGSLTDAGSVQQWREPLNSNQDAEGANNEK